MIRKVTIQNFKNVLEQTYEFKQFDLLVGKNNSGKSTILQALAIWQYCINEFDHAKRKGSTRGVGIVLPNFTALPVPEFNLLWREKTERRYPKTVSDKKKQEYILITIDVHWEKSGKSHNFKIQLRYQSPQMIHAIPADGWNKLKELEENHLLPQIAFVPPFSGLMPVEGGADEGAIRQQIGMAQPGRVLRNLLLRVRDKPEDWKEVHDVIEKWFSVDLMKPQYDKTRDTRIVCEYRDKNDKKYDIISGGSGFHQTLTLLAFFYGYHPTTLMLDEPDAHLHVNLQQEILNYFKQKSLEYDNQFLIATHAEALIKEVDSGNILCLLGEKPKRIPSTMPVIRAMADVTNLEATQIMNTKAILYLEGESDERILGMWAKSLSYDIIRKIYIHRMGGGTKEIMRDSCDRHFEAIKVIVPNTKRQVLFDNDGRPIFLVENPAYYEWKRKNIENYLLVPSAWIRASSIIAGIPQGDLFLPLLQPYIKIIDNFFVKQNLTLPAGESWKTISANIFEVVDGKKILFENDDSLFHQLRKKDAKMELRSDIVAASMLPDEIHNDVDAFFAKLSGIVEQ